MILYDLFICNSIYVDAMLVAQHQCILTFPFYLSNVASLIIQVFVFSIILSYLFFCSSDHIAIVLCRYVNFLYRTPSLVISSNIVATGFFQLWFYTEIAPT